MASLYIKYPSLVAVTSINSLTGAVTLTAGSNISLTPSGNNITIASSPFAFFASSQVTTDSTGVTSTFPTFTTFDNSPAFTITPTISGTYKVYCNLPLDTQGLNSQATGRIINTSGGATLLYESQVHAGAGTTNYAIATCTAMSVYTLVAGTTYVFDIQGAVDGGSDVVAIGTTSSFYMFAERVS